MIWVGVLLRCFLVVSPLCLIQQNSLSSLPSLNCSKTWVVIFMGKSRFRLPTSILKFTYSTKLDTCNINSSDQQGWKQTTIFENICSVQEVERQHERGSSNSEVPITVGMSQNVTDQMGRAGQPTVLFQWRSGKRTSKKTKTWKWVLIQLPTPGNRLFRSLSHLSHPQLLKTSLAYSLFSITISITLAWVTTVLLLDYFRTF